MKWILLSCLSLNVYAYQFTSDFQNGYYWASFPLFMTRFAVDETEGNLLESLTQEAEQAWEDASGVDIWQFEDVIGPYTNGLNYIRWSENFADETGYDPYSTLAITIRYSEGTHMVRTEIILNGQMSALKENQDRRLYKTLLHELGHTIALGHSSEEAIMAPYIGSLDELTEDDHSGVVAVIVETQFRQATGFRSPLAPQEQERAQYSTGCGTIDTNGPGNGPSGMLPSLFLGLLIAAMGRLKGSRFFLP